MLNRRMPFSPMALALLGIFSLPAIAAEYKVDPVHSSVSFSVNHLGASNIHGMIPDVSGKVSFDPEDPSANSLDLSVNVSSLSTFNAARDKHLAGPDFFNAKQFPTATFKSTAWKSTGDGEFEITGTLTLLGVKKSVTAKARHIGFGKNRAGKILAGFEAEFAIDRTDFGMNYGVAEQGGLGREVTLIIAIEAIKL